MAGGRKMVDPALVIVEKRTHGRVVPGRVAQERTTLEALGT